MVWVSWFIKITKISWDLKNLQEFYIIIGIEILKKVFEYYSPLCLGAYDHWRHLYATLFINVYYHTIYVERKRNPFNISLVNKCRYFSETSLYWNQSCKVFLFLLERKHFNSHFGKPHFNPNSLLNPIFAKASLLVLCFKKINQFEFNNFKHKLEGWKLLLYIEIYFLKRAPLLPELCLN